MTVNDSVTKITECYCVQFHTNTDIMTHPLFAKLHNYPLLSKHILNSFYKFCFSANQFVDIDGISLSSSFFSTFL